MKRYGNNEEVAKLALFLGSDDVELLQTVLGILSTGAGQLHKVRPETQL